MSAPTSRNRVLVTGIGLLGPGADSPESFWSMLEAGGAPRPQRLATVEGDYLGFPAGDAAPASESRLERLALQAAANAVADAALAPEALGEAGVYWGTTHGSIDVFERAQMRQSAAGRAHQLYGVTALVAERFHCGGPQQVFSTACSASLNAIGLAAEQIADGCVDVMLAGGAELCSRVGLAAFSRLGGIDSQYCRPFDQRREGAVFGEGAAVLILESEAHFVARGGQRAYCSVDGFGWSCDAHHVTAPEPSGELILAAMRDALARAGKPAEAIGCILPHGTGTRLNDQVEASALAGLLGERLAATPVFPLKAFIGHGAGAAGVFSCAVAALICARRSVPGVVNCEQPEFELFLPPTGTRVPGLDSVLVNGYAFGGNNASVVLGALQ
jgi:3-oxoacyl-(acyl-carrier-protein) synthase